MTEKDRKPGANIVDGFLRDLKRKPWIGNRSWWPDYAFHFTDIKNVASILNHGFLYSRNGASRDNLIVEDSASTQIIGQTESALTTHVRFYFRPLTPTAYRNEGFRPLPTLYHDAHCPVPVYLLFDLRALISFKDTRFSDGSLARTGYAIRETAADFSELPFRDIYHNSGWGSETLERRNQIKNRRHAEIIHPGRVSLDHLKNIVCRSQAEYQTLQNMLSPLPWNRWKHCVAVSKRRRLFYGEWLYVKEVSLLPHKVKIEFSFPSASRFYGPFSMRVDIHDNISGVNGYFEQDYQDIAAQLPSSRLELDLSSLSPRNYAVRISIDKNLAYIGKYAGDDIPF